jgi:hypothetical protein
MLTCYGEIGTLKSRFKFYKLKKISKYWKWKQKDDTNEIIQAVSNKRVVETSDNWAFDDLLLRI